MPDQYLQQLDRVTTAADTDLLPISDDPAGAARLRAIETQHLFASFTAAVVRDASGDIAFGGATRYDASEDRTYTTQAYAGGLGLGNTVAAIQGGLNGNIVSANPTFTSSYHIALPVPAGGSAVPNFKASPLGGFGWTPNNNSWQNVADTGFIREAAGLIRAAHSSTTIDNLQLGYCEHWASTSTTLREVAGATPSWSVATDASRTGRVTHTVEDFAGSRETFREEATGTAAAIGFLGATAVTRQTVTGSRTDGTALASLLTALASLGLITDSTTA
ncbi:MAG: hypothetical protein WBC44_04640 [Planctomycetaceae bacterium]